MKNIIKRMEDADLRTKLIVVVVLVIIFIFLYRFSNKDKPDLVSQENVTSTSTDTVKENLPKQNTQVATKPKNTVSPSEKCGFMLINPVLNSKVSFPLTLTGVIDDIRGDAVGCSWNHTESRGGTAELFYYSQSKGWQSSGVPVGITAHGSVSTPSSSTPFSVTVNMWTAASGITSGAPLKVRFTELTKSNSTSLDSFDVPLFLK